MLETMFKAIPDEVILLDRDRKVVMSNRDDIEPGDYCYKSYFHRDKPCENCRLARILAEKTPVMLTMKHDDRFLQVHALPVYNKDHEVDGILEFYRDVTLEKTMDQQLQQADKLASLGQLVSGIGHEINNPNQFIRGNIKIIKQALEDILPIVDDYYRLHPELKIARLDYNFFRSNVMVLVDDMSHGSERIKGIVEGLRNFVRKDEGLLVDKVDINTLIEAATRLVHNQVHKRADIELELARDIPLFTGNSQKIEQVLINLIVNAGDAMPEDKKGVIKVRTLMDRGWSGRRGGGQREGHEPKRSETDIRSLLHDEKGAGGDGARARDRLQDRRGARRQHIGQKQAGRRHDIHDQDPRRETGGPWQRGEG